MNAIKTTTTNEIAITTAMYDVMFSDFTAAESAILRAEPGLLLGAMAYYGEQQALVAQGVFLFAPGIKDIVRDYLHNTMEMLQSEARAINEEADAFDFARISEME